MIYLAQTDTTAGLLSKDFKALNKAKKRDENTPCLRAVCSFFVLKNIARIPQKHRNLLRKAKKTSFILPNGESFRVVKQGQHARFLRRFSWLYSTSANLHGHDFDENIARNLADEVIGEEFFQAPSSKIYRLSKRHKRRMR